jgi:hypothetical protein
MMFILRITWYIQLAKCVYIYIIFEYVVHIGLESIEPGRVKIQNSTLHNKRWGNRKLIQSISRFHRISAYTYRHTYIAYTHIHTHKTTGPAFLFVVHRFESSLGYRVSRYDYRGFPQWFLATVGPASWNRLWPARRNHSKLTIQITCPYHSMLYSLWRWNGDDK